MTEAALKSTLTALLRAQLPSFLVFRHEDKMTSGIPDISTTGNKRTVWIEVKYADPQFDCAGLQELTALRLATHGWACFFVIYELRNKVRTTYIVHPKRLSEWMKSEVRADGFNHQWVVDYVRGVHS